MLYALVWAALAVFLHAPLCDSADVRLSFDEGLYADDVKFLGVAPVRVHLFGSTASNEPGGNLHVKRSYRQAGRDAVGTFHEESTEWTADHWPQDGRTYFVTTVRNYHDRAAFVFEQRFPEGAKACDLSRHEVRASFPALQLNSSDVGFYNYYGLFLSNSQFGTLDNPDVKDGIEAGPLLLFNQKRFAAVISSYNEFMTQTTHVEVARRELQMGPLGSLCDLPRGYKAQSLLVFSEKGIKSAVKRWGKLLQKTYLQENRHEDFTSGNLGYSTDNGAWYYYQKDPATNNMEETLLRIKAEADSNSIPYKHWLLDSWWYYQDPVGQGVTDWRARPDVFPHGMESLFRKTGMYVQAHNRFWAPKNVYENDYKFLVENATSLPLERRFWDDLFRTSLGWGLRVYEQDWLNIQFKSLHEAAFKSPTVMRQWLLQMGDAARSSGITIQYCMPLSRHLLQSIELPAVTQARASLDYVSEEQWNIGAAAMMHSALGLRPSKDSSWSASTQPGNRWNRTEQYPDLQMTMMALSTGPVTFSDRIGHSVRWRIMRTCRSDGVLLQPSHPPSPLHDWFVDGAFGRARPSLLETSMAVAGAPPYIVVVAVDVSERVLLGCRQLHACHRHRLYVQYRYSVTDGRVGNVQLRRFNPTTPLSLGPCGRSDFELVYIAPILSGADQWVLLGELNKVVPIAKRRILAVRRLGHALVVDLEGAPEERVDIYVASMTTGKVTKLATTLGANGRGVVEARNEKTLEAVPDIVIE